MFNEFQDYPENQNMENVTENDDNTLSDQIVVDEDNQIHDVCLNVTVDKDNKNNLCTDTKDEINLKEIATFDMKNVLYASSEKNEEHTEDYEEFSNAIALDLQLHQRECTLINLHNEDVPAILRTHCKIS